MKTLFKYKKYIPIIIGLSLVLFFSIYKLTESPPVWMDEGIITQVAKNIALHGINGIQVAPEVFDPAWYVTTSYTVTLPISIIFSLFESGILQARSVMVFFIIVLYFATYILIKRNRYSVVIFTLFFLATFAPLYGQGKNVLGEVPGLVFLVIGLIFLNNIDLKLNFKIKNLNFLIAGLFFGLSIATKPIFILILPALFCTFFIYRNKLLINKRIIIFTTVGLALPIIFWIFFQFGESSLHSVISLYSNPNDVSISKYVFTNIKRFFTEIQPMYALLLFLIWTFTGVFRYRKGIKPDFGELLAWIFSLLVFMAYFRTIGFYRYFFVPEILSIIYVIPSIFNAIKNKKLIFLVYILFLLLITFQFYQTVFNSWVADYYQSRRTENIQSYMSNFNNQNNIFFYQVPEVVLFATNNKYYQYFVITDSLIVGEKELDYLIKGLPDLVIIPARIDPSTLTLFSHYHIKESFDRYHVLEK